MHSTFSKALVAALAFGAVHAAAVPRQEAPKDNTALLEKLLTDATAIRRFQRVLTKGGKELITGDELTEATVLDFNKNVLPVPASQGGKTSTADLETYPILLGSGMTTTVVSVGPCGVLAPHVHPRANEIFVVVDGEADFGYTLERGLIGLDKATPEITGKMMKYEGTLFPQGSIHFQVHDSPDCKGFTAVTILNSDDPGTTPVLLEQPSAGNGTVAPRQVDGKDFDLLRHQLPAGIVAKVDKCLARCSVAKA